MRKFRLIAFIVFCACTSGQTLAKDIARYFNNATTNTTDFMSSFSCTDKDHLSEGEVRLWISKNKSYFYNPDSVIIKGEEHWVYGARNQMITKVYFVTASNGPKRKSYFEGAKREKEEQRQAEIKRREDAAQAEKDRLQRIKKEIENGTFTGIHFYDYPEGHYDGGFVRGFREGHGKQLLRNGEWYEGDFKGGFANGIGTYRQSNGIRFTGNFVNGRRQGKFTAKRWTLGGLIADEWLLEYENDVLISEIQTQSDLTDFVNSMSKSSPDSYQSYSSNSNANQDCEADAIREFDAFDKSKIKYEEWKMDELNIDYAQFIQFPDGVNGRVFQGSSTKKYFLEIKGYNVYYSSYTNMVKALYIYKKCGIEPKFGKD